MKHRNRYWSLIVFVLIGVAPVTGWTAQPDKLDKLIDGLSPLDATTWIGWSNAQPCPLYLLREGAPPVALGKLPAAPVSMAIRGDQVLWLGAGYRAVAPWHNPSAITVKDDKENWTLVVGSKVGFVKTDDARLAFSTDGENWQFVAAELLAGATRVAGLASDGNRFVVLLELSREDEGDYRHSILAMSEDGRKWENTYFSEPSPGEPELTTLAYGNGRWMVYGAGSVYSSRDGREWTPITAGRNAKPELRDAFIHTGGGEWWAENWKDQFEFSPDGLDWSAEPQYLHQLSKGSGSFWVVGTQGMRNLALDAEGKLRVATVAAMQAVAPSRPTAMVVAKPGALAKPAAAAAKPPAPAAAKIAPAKVARLSNEELAKRWARLDEQLHAEETPVGFSRRLGELALLFSQAENNEVNLAVQTGALVYVLQNGDAACLAAFKPALSAKEYADAQLIMKKGLEVKSALLAKGEAVPPVARGERGAQMADRRWDTHQMRLSFLNGKRGSAYDMAVAHMNSSSFNKDADMSRLWSFITQNIIPELGLLDYESPQGVEILLAAGSGVAAANSVGEANINRGEQGFTSRQWALIEQATSAGLLPAKKILDARAAWRVDAAHMPEPVWPPAAFAKWDEAKKQGMRPLFERHAAFSRDAMAYRAALTPGVAPNRSRWLALLARHEALLKDPAIQALREGYVQTPVGMALLYAADSPISPSWLIAMKEAKAGLAAVAINPDLWNFRARMLLWSGQLEEARRDVAMALLMLELETTKADVFFDLLERNTRTLALELNLPESVLTASRHAISSYNLSAAKRNVLLGKSSPEVDDVIIRLYANFGQRLQVAWSLPDADQRERVVTDLCTIYRDDLRGLAYPKTEFEALLKRFTAIWAVRQREPQRALRELEELIRTAAHPFLLMRRAELLGAAGDRAGEVNALQAILSIWGSYDPVIKRLAFLEGDVRAKEEAAALAKATALAQAEYKEALELLNRGESVAGRAVLERAAKGEKPTLRALLLLAELQTSSRQPAEAEATLRRALAEHRQAPAAARLGLMLVGQQKLVEARSVLNRVGKPESEAPEVQAVRVLVDTLTAVKSVPSAGPLAIERAVSQLEALRAKRFAVEVHAILAQFKMMQRDQAGAVAELALMVKGTDYAPPETWFQIGQTMSNLGDAEGAKVYVEKAAALGLPQAQEWLKKR